MKTQVRGPLELTFSELEWDEQMIPTEPKEDGTKPYFYKGDLAGQRFQDLREPLQEMVAATLELEPVVGVVAIKSAVYVKTIPSDLSGPAFGLLVLNLEEIVRQAVSKVRMLQGHIALAHRPGLDWPR